MAQNFIIRLIEEGDRPEIARLEFNDVIVGREPEDGVALPSKAVSREHGIFINWADRWFYKDLGSSNGSWLNSTRLEAEELTLIKDGDILQLGDLGLEVCEYGEMGLVKRGLVVLQRGTLLKEFPIPETGRVLSIGGTRGDLKMDVDIYEHPALVFEMRGQNLCAFSINRDIEVTHNGQPLLRTVLLADRDDFRVANYRVIYSEGRAVEEAVTAAVQDGPAPQQPAAEKKSSEEKKRQAPTRSSFGRVFDKDEDEIWSTQALDPEALEGAMARIVPASRRSLAMPDEKKEENTGLETSVLVTMIAVSFIAAAGAVIWWILQ